MEQKYPDPAEGSRIHKEFFDVENKRIDASVLEWRVAPGVRPSDEYLASQGFFGLIRTATPAYDPRTQRVREAPPEGWVVDNVAKTVTQVWIVDLLGEEDIAAITASRTAAVREERNRRLRESDFTQMADAPINQTDKGKWQQYRKALRDLTKDMDIWAVKWPEPPAPTTE